MGLWPYQSKRRRNISALVVLFVHVLVCIPQVCFVTNFFQLSSSLKVSSKLCDILFLRIFTFAKVII